MFRIINISRIGFVISTSILPAALQAQYIDSDAQIVGFVKDFSYAQTSFDQAALARLTTPEYLEVSPLGDVDSREQMLSFYAPEKKGPSPVITLSNPMIRRDAQSTLVIVMLSYAAPSAPAGVGPAVMRASFLLRKAGSNWRIAFAQYTPQRSLK